jgi:hypothetical protein
MSETPKPADAAKDTAQSESFVSKLKAGFSSPIENVKANFFSKEAYASGNRFKTGIRVAGTGIGLVMAADALRAEREGADGRPEARSGLMRVSEAVLGLGLAAGSAVYPGR